MDNLQKRKLPLFNGSQNFKGYFEELNSIVRILKPIKGFRSEIATIFYASSISNLIMLAPMIYLLQIFDRIMISQSLVSLGSLTGLLAFLYIVMIKAEKIRSKLIISFGLKLDSIIHESCMTDHLNRGSEEVELIHFNTMMTLHFLGIGLQVWE